MMIENESNLTKKKNDSNLIFHVVRVKHIAANCIAHFFIVECSACSGNLIEYYRNFSKKWYLIWRLGVVNTICDTNVHPNHCIESRSLPMFLLLITYNIYFNVWCNMLCWATAAHFIPRAKELIESYKNVHRICGSTTGIRKCLIGDSPLL